MRGLCRRAWRPGDDAASPDRNGRLWRCGVPGSYVLCSWFLPSLRCLSLHRGGKEDSTHQTSRVAGSETTQAEDPDARIPNHVRTVRLGNSAAFLSAGSAECRWRLLQEPLRWPNSPLKRALSSAV